MAKVVAASRTTARVRGARSGLTLSEVLKNFDTPVAGALTDRSNTFAPTPCMDGPIGSECWKDKLTGDDTGCQESTTVISTRCRAKFDDEEGPRGAVDPWEELLSDPAPWDQNRAVSDETVPAAVGVSADAGVGISASVGSLV